MLASMPLPPCLPVCTPAGPSASSPPFSSPPAPPPPALSARPSVRPCVVRLSCGYTQPYNGKADPTKLLCYGRTAGTTSPSDDPTQYPSQSWVKVTPGASSVTSGGAPVSLASLVNITLDSDGTTANITLSGPAGVWFGVGFDAEEMSDLPYAIIVDGAGQVTERKLVKHGE
jgi:hypothetical protein